MNPAGRAGEERAARYLQRRGWKIVARNFRTRWGEIDLVAEKGGVRAFVEVKTRADDRFAAPREFVTPAKQRRLVAAAEAYLAAFPAGGQPRFDVVEVYLSPGFLRPARIVHWENAFEA